MLRLEYLFCATYIDIMIDNENVSYTLVGQITAYCEQVNAGAKLCAQLLCIERYLPLAMEMIEREQCRCFCREVSPEAVAVFIYKYDFVELLIEELLISNDGDIPSASRVWASGKLFGYSDFEIWQYLKEHGYLDDIKTKTSLG